jgi:hypothetical protein
VHALQLTLNHNRTNALAPASEYTSYSRPCPTCHVCHGPSVKPSVSHVWTVVLTWGDQPAPHRNLVEEAYCIATIRGRQPVRQPAPAATIINEEYFGNQCQKLYSCPQQQARWWY